MTMLIGEEYKKMIEQKYAEAVETGAESIVIDEKTLGELKLFITKKPAYTISTFILDDGAEVFVGAESIEAVS